jgi:hypothetical protein
MRRRQKGKDRGEKRMGETQGYRQRESKRRVADERHLRIDGGKETERESREEETKGKTKCNRRS